MAWAVSFYLPNLLVSSSWYADTKPIRLELYLNISWWHKINLTRVILENFTVTQNQSDQGYTWIFHYDTKLIRLGIYLNISRWHKTNPTRDILEYFTVLNFQFNLGRTFEISRIIKFVTVVYHQSENMIQSWNDYFRY